MKTIKVDHDLFEDHTMDFKNSSILITGSNGFMAQYLVDYLFQINKEESLNIHLILTSRDISKTEEKYSQYVYEKFVELYEVDVCKEIKIDQEVDYIIHLAGLSDPKRMKDDPCGTFTSNTVGLNNVLQFAISKNVRRVLYVSSYMVYGSYENEKMMEDAYYTPVDFSDISNVYCISKRAGEMLCNCYSHQFDTEICIIRPSFIFGASQISDKRVFAQILMTFSKDEDFCLNSDGLTERAVCYVKDVVRAMIYVLLNGKCLKPYCCESNITTIRNFAEIASMQSEIGVLKYDKPVVQVQMSKLSSTTKLKYDDSVESLGWRPIWNMEDAIKDAISIMRRQYIF